MKHALAISLAAATALCSAAAFASAPRISAADFAKDPAKVKVLQNGVAAMRKNDAAPNTTAAFLASWQYWANIHGYLGTGPNAAGTVATYVPQQIAARCSGDPAT